MNQPGDHPPDPTPLVLDDGFFAGVVAESPDPYLVVDLSGTIRWASRSAADIVGVAHGEYVGRPVTDFIAPSSLDIALEAFAEYSSPGRLDTGWIGPPLPIELLHREGHVVPCEVRRVPSPVSIQGIVLTVSTSVTMSSLYEAIERIVADAPLDEVMASIVRLIADETPFSIPVIGLGWDGHRFSTVAAHDDAPALDGDHLPAVPDGRSPWHVQLTTGGSIADESLSEIDPALRDAATRAGAVACWALPIEIGDDSDPLDPAIGRSVLVLWRRAPGRPRLNVIRRLDRIRGLIGLAMRSAHSRQQLRRAARTDAVSGLPNRLALMEHIEEIARRPDTELVGLLFCDLDHFKLVNDRYGHPTGDRVLRVAADRMRSRLRRGDIVARVGGDEFVVVTRTTDLDAVEGLAERLLGAFEAPIVLGELSVRVGTSVGVATATATDLARGTVTGDDLIERADAALLAAKATGKHRITWAD